MIPISLTLSGFLSYRDPVELDFSRFDLACISGSNGAGKSSLLDAITWALFGQARKRDESLIHTAASAAEVTLTFAYESNLYKIQRSLPRGKTSMLEFHIQQSEIGNQPSWRPLTEATLRATQARIEQTLRLDYDTFVNASFFLQGKADHFTQQRPADRKRILASILGLEVWEIYRQGAADRRRLVEEEIARLDGRMAEIAAELAEEDARKAHLTALNQRIEASARLRSARAQDLETARKLTAVLEEHKKLVDSLSRQMEAAARRLKDLDDRRAARQTERESYTQWAARAPEIGAAHLAWQTARAELERWDAAAAQFRQHEARRQPFLDIIHAARAALAQEQKTLLEQENAHRTKREELPPLSLQISTIETRITQLGGQLAERAAFDQLLSEARARQSDAKAENPRLKAEMDELKARMDQLSSAEGAACPLCGQPLSDADRKKHLDDMKARGTEKGDRFRANLAVLKETEFLLAQYDARSGDFARLEAERAALAPSLAVLQTRSEQAQQALAVWEQRDAPRLLEVTAALEKETFAAEARQSLAAVDAELKALGYDAAAHDDARRREQAGRTVEEELRALERAQSALAPLERELTELNVSRNVQYEECQRLQADHASALATLTAAQASTPNVYAAERELFDLQEQENRLRLEAGAALQKVLVLDDLRERQRAFTAEREEKARRVGQYKQLERAFGKDGVPALLIEQALPQIEARANDLLERLSGGGMTVRFVTQAAYKDKKRDDLKETLDIQISDSVGTRDYEMFSGGEAFRVNFAIRLALSEVLAQRAGARLQTLVIDEGFGSQDAQGRQRLIEAINTIKSDFAKILVITHIDELKDAFPTRIEVEKTERGSAVRIV
jgi:exonuclease SbcC